MASRSALRKIGLLWLVSSLVSSTTAMSIAVPSKKALDMLRQRDSTCPSSNESPCTSTDPNLPGNFCCSANETCVSLDSSSSALCCPEGQNCSTIQTISCDVRLQNTTAHPDASIMTKNLGGTLPTCGNNCCPFGYVCDTSSNNICRINAATSISTSSRNSTSVSPASASAGATGSSQPFHSALPSNGIGINSNSPSVRSQCPGFPGPAIAAGFFPGVLAGALLALIGVIFLGKSGPVKHTSTVKSKNSPSHLHTRSADGSIIGISEPIPAAQSHRTDFIRRPPDFLSRSATRAKSWFSSKSSPTYAANGSPYRQENHWKMPTPPVTNNIPMQPLGTTGPVTPERQTGASVDVERATPKQPSTESMRVYSPLNARERGHVPVPPIRGMANRWRANSGNEGSFRTPERTNLTQTRAPEGNEVYLTPTRYGDDARDREGYKTKENIGDGSGEKSRRDTTFTDMLQVIGFPDPEPRPPIPEIPRGLNVGKKGRRT